MSRYLQTDDDDEHSDDEHSDDEVAMELGDLVRRISRRLRQGSTKRLAPFGLSDGQARVLRLVGQSRPPLRMSGIAERIEIVPRSVTTVVEGLEAKGFVVREIDAEDRRSILVRLTDAGGQLLKVIGQARDEAAVALFARLEQNERAELLRLLGALDQSPDPGLLHDRAGQSVTDGPWEGRRP